MKNHLLSNWIFIFTSLFCFFNFPLNAQVIGFKAAYNYLHVDFSLIEEIQIDFNSDGKIDFLTLNKLFNNYSLSFCTIENGELRPISTSPAFDDLTTHFTPVIINYGGPKILLCFNSINYVICDFTFKEIKRFTFLGDKLNFADINNDDHDDLIYYEAGMTHLYDIYNNLFLAKAPTKQTYNIVKGNFNNSPGFEYILHAYPQPYLINSVDYSFEVLNLPPGGSFNSIDYDHDGKDEIILNHDTLIRIYNLETGATLDSLNKTISHLPLKITGDSGQRILLGYSNYFKIIDPKNLQKAAEEKFLDIEFIRGCYVDDSLQKIKIIGTVNGLIRIIDWETGSIDYDQKLLKNVNWMTKTKHPAINPSFFKFDLKSELKYDNNLITEFSPELKKIKEIKFESDFIPVKSQFLQLRGLSKFELFEFNEFGFKVSDAESFQFLYKFNLPQFTYIVDTKIADLDGDGKVDLIVLTSKEVYYFYYDGNTFVSRNTGIQVEYPAAKFAVGNLDDDIQSEIVLYTSIEGINKKYLMIIDGKDFTIQKSIENYEYASYLGIIDINSNGINRIIAREGDFLKMYDNKLNLVLSKQINRRVDGIDFANLNSSPELELIVTGKNLEIRSGINFDLIQSIDSVYCEFVAPILIRDLDLNGKSEVVILTEYGVKIYETINTIADMESPYVFRSIPDELINKIHLSQHIIFSFSERMDISYLNENYIKVKDNNGNNITCKIIIEEGDFKLIIAPLDKWPASAELHIEFSHELKDFYGNYFDGNKDGVGANENVDNFNYRFNTSALEDFTGPKVISAHLDETSIYRGNSGKLHIQVTDLLDGINSGLENVEYFLDDKGLDGSGISLQNSIVDDELITYHINAEFSTIGLNNGIHNIFIHGKDKYNNWGDWNELTFEVFEESKDNWPKLHHDDQRTKTNLFSEVPKEMVELWRDEDLEPNAQAVCIADGNVYVFRDKTDELVCMDAISGESKWTVPIVRTSDIVKLEYYKGYILFGYRVFSDDTNVIGCFNSKNGLLKWNKIYDFQFSFFPFNDKVYLSAGKNIDLESGTVENRFDSFGLNFDCSVLFEDTLMYSYHDSYVNANTLHPVDLKSDIDFDKDCMDGGMLYDELNNQFIANSWNYCVAFDLIHNKLNWNTWDYSSTGLSIFGDTVLYANQSGINAIGAKDGKLKWKNLTSIDFYFGTVNSKYYTFIGSWDKTYILDRKGNHVGSINFSGDYMLAKDILLIRRDNKLVAYGSRDLNKTIRIKGEELRVMPNPASGKVIFDLERLVAGDFQLCIYNSSGFRVFDGQYNSRIAPLTLDIGHFSQGVYFCNIIQNGKIFNTKFLKV